jgi:hypothetical protein
VALAQLPPAGEDPDRQLEHLRLLCARLATLRRGDHDVQWLQIERDRLALLAKKIEAATKKNGAGPQLTKSGGIPPEVMAQVEKELRLL